MPKITYKFSQQRLKNFAKKVLRDDPEKVLTSYNDYTKAELILAFKAILSDPEVFLKDALSMVHDAKDAELQLLKTTCAKLKHKLSHYDMVIEELKNYIKVYPTPKFKKIEVAKQIRTTRIPILVISDAHIGEVVNLNFYEYSTEVAWNIAGLIVEKAREIIREKSIFNYNQELYVFFLGDMVSGLIHDELLRTNDLTPVSQVLEAGHIMGWIVNELSRFNNVNVFAIVGNHGRFFKKKDFKEKYNSLDYLSYHIARLTTRNNSRVKWHIPEHGFALINVHGWNFFLQHGDNIKSWAGIPYYGINRADNNYTAMMVKYEDTKIHYFIRGHFHTTMIGNAPLGKTFVNGTWKKADEYTYEGGVYRSEAEQLLLELTPEDGITGTYFIKL